MALAPSQLEQQLRRLFTRPPKRSADAAFYTAAAYAAYTSGSSAGLALPIFTGLEAAAMVGILTPPFTNPSGGSPNRYAQALADAVLGFWMLPPVIFQTPPFPAPPLDAGPILPTPGADLVFKSSVVSVVSALRNTAYQAAAGVAAALDVYTRTFTVTLVPSLTVVPIT